MFVTDSKHHYPFPYAEVDPDFSLASKGWTLNQLHYPTYHKFCLTFQSILSIPFIVQIGR